MPPKATGTKRREKNESATDMDCAISKTGAQLRIIADVKSSILGSLLYYFLCVSVRFEFFHNKKVSFVVFPFAV